MSLPVVYRRIFYRVESKRVVVLTVLHTARDPKTWPRARKTAR